jgi:glycosyltransferase involved in cell wall biosynthesis
MNIVKKYRSKFDIIISEKDNGMYDALNKGIKLASGDIIGILNSDDEYFNNDIINIISKKFSENSNLDAVYGDVAFVNSENELLRYYSAKNWSPGKFKIGNMPPHPSFYCKRNLFYKYGFYNTDFRIAGDFELLLRFIFVNKITCEYIPCRFVNMKLGGLSTNGLKSIYKINNEILKAFKLNNLKTNYILLYSRYIKKSLQFLNK